MLALDQIEPEQPRRVAALALRPPRDFERSLVDLAPEAQWKPANQR
jgi:hypothetical protein